MKKKTKYKFFKIIIALAFLLILPLTVSATDLYVRPVGEASGVADGTSYDNAFDGLTNVPWGPGGVQPGDELYVCGLHIHNMTNPYSYIVSQADINMIGGTSEDARITVRGDCPGNNGFDQGIVWGAYRMMYQDWIDEGDGVYSMTFTANHYPDWYFQDAGIPNNEDFIVLDKETSVEDVKANPGSFAAIPDSTRDSKLYVHMTDSDNPTGRVLINRWGYDFKIINNSYITFKNLTYHAMYRISGFYPGTNPHHLTWDGCKIDFSEHSNLAFYDNMHHIKIINCELSWASNSIYLISTTTNSPRDFLIKGNYIHDIGVRGVNINTDAHAVGTQGVSNMIVEDNFIENTGNAILLYAFSAQESKNNIIRNNIVKDCHTIADPSSFGIATQCNNDAYADKSGTKIYNNIVINCTHGYRFQWEQKHEIYNNIAYGCQEGLASTRNYLGLGANVKLRNNIFMNNNPYHINWGSGARVNYILDSDYNLFYPAEGDVFRHAVAGGDQTFEEWQTHIDTKLPSCCLFDLNSIAEDPLFVDPDNGDFSLREGSPAIDAGIDVGLPYQGLAPDIGAFESDFLSGGASCDIDGDINGDCNVTIIDLILVAADFGKTSGYNSKADTDGNQVIDIFDIVFVARRIT